MLKLQTSDFVVFKNRIHEIYSLLKKPVICAVFLISTLFWVSILWSALPRQILFSFNSNSCISQPMLLPNLFKTSNNTFKIYASGGFKISTIQITSTKLCAEPISIPRENAKNNLTLNLLGKLPFKKITVTTTLYPAINFSTFNQPLPPAQSAKLQLDKNDVIFEYQLATGDKKTSCNINATDLECPIQKLNLTPGSTNKATLERLFNNQQVGEVFNGNIKMLEPLNIISGNMVNGNIILDNPRSFELVFDKPLAKANTPQLFIKNGDKHTEISLSQTIQDNKLVITPSEPIKRRSIYIFKLKQAMSVSGNVLIDEYQSEFNVSGGPKVIGHNTGTYAYDPNKTIVINFDQELKINQNLATIVTLVGNSIPPFAITTSGKSIFVNPNGILPSCTNITIQINALVQNKYEISGDSTWKHSFRTLCKRTSVIGTSSQGRSIEAYWFGSGPSMILFVGGIHGNEKSSVLTLESWLGELEKYADRIPTGRTIVVITNINPDGYSANSRLNMQGVDLNRNFPSANWSSTVSGPGYSGLVNGGGTSPLSAPESSALANFSKQYRPRLVLSFHAIASLVSPNYVGDSETIANLYASKTPYNFANASQTDAALGYATTGDFEFWLRDIGVPNILIEQSTLAKNEFTKNREALWAMVGL